MTAHEQREFFANIEWISRILHNADTAIFEAHYKAARTYVKHANECLATWGLEVRNMEGK